MPKIAQILFPKKEGFVGKIKPSILILSSPYDVASAAVRYSNVFDVITDRGYTCLNKRPICFFDEGFKKSTKPSQSKKKELTIWLEAHGAHGWLFGEEPSADAEMSRTIEFANYTRDIENHTGLTVTNIILSCCYSANEFLNPETNQHYSSPARLLSALLPNTTVMGFVGQNASAKGTSLYQFNKGSFIPKVAPLEQIAILFQAGRTLELSSSALYCDVVSMPAFISIACGGVEPKMKYDSFAATRALDELMALPSYGNDDEKDCYGTFQMREVSFALKKGLDETIASSAEIASTDEAEYRGRGGEEFGYGDESDDEPVSEFLPALEEEALTGKAPHSPVKPTDNLTSSNNSTNSAADKPLLRDRAGSGYGLSSALAAGFFCTRSSPLLRSVTPGCRDSLSPSKQGPPDNELSKKGNHSTVTDFAKLRG